MTRQRATLPPFPHTHRMYGHCVFFQRSLCGHCTVTVRSLYGHCTFPHAGLGRTSVVLRPAVGKPHDAHVGPARRCSTKRIHTNGPSQWNYPSPEGRYFDRRVGRPAMSSVHVGQSVCLSVGRPVDWPVGLSVKSVCRSVSGSVGRGGSSGRVGPGRVGSVGRPATRPLGRSVSRSVGRSARLGRQFGSSVGPSVVHSFVRSVGR